MARGWERADSGVLTVLLEPVEQDVLASLLDQVIQLLDPDGVTQPKPSPMTVLLDLNEQTSVTRPTDPVLARLLPDAHRDDEQIAAEFRRFTEYDVRREKVARAQQVRRVLTAGTELITVEADAAEDWLRALNDVRLALGTRLGIDDDSEIADDDQPASRVYAWLGWLQHSLLDALDGR